MTRVQQRQLSTRWGLGLVAMLLVLALRLRSRLTGRSRRHTSSGSGRSRVGLAWDRLRAATPAAQGSQLGRGTTSRERGDEPAAAGVDRRRHLRRRPGGQLHLRQPGLRRLLGYDDPHDCWASRRTSCSTTTGPTAAPTRARSAGSTRRCDRPTASRSTTRSSGAGTAPASPSSTAPTRSSTTAGRSRRGRHLRGRHADAAGRRGGDAAARERAAGHRPGRLHHRPRGADEPIIYVNAAFERLTGYALREVKGPRDDVPGRPRHRPGSGRGAARGVPRRGQTIRPRCCCTARTARPSGRPCPCSPVTDGADR